jgi:hypothetical protein
MQPLPYPTLHEERVPSLYEKGRGNEGSVWQVTSFLALWWSFWAWRRLGPQSGESLFDQFSSRVQPFEEYP